MHLFKVGRRQGVASSVRLCACALSVWRWVLLLPSMLQSCSIKESPRRTRPRPRTQQQGRRRRTLIIILHRRLLDVASPCPRRRRVLPAAGVAGAPCRARRLVRSALFLRETLHVPTPWRQVQRDSTTFMPHACTWICTKRESSFTASRLALLSRGSCSCVRAHTWCVQMRGSSLALEQSCFTCGCVALWLAACGWCCRCT